MRYARLRTATHDFSIPRKNWMLRTIFPMELEKIEMLFHQYNI